MSRKTLGLAAAIARMGRETGAGRALLPGGSRVVLETDEMVSRLGQISQAVTRSLKSRECAGAVVFMALGTVLRVCCAEPNPQGRVLGPAECDLTRLAILEALRLESWMLRSSTGIQPRGKSRARVTSLQMVSLLPHAATAKTPSLEGLVHRVTQWASPSTLSQVKHAPFGPMRSCHRNPETPLVQVPRPALEAGAHGTSHPFLENHWQLRDVRAWSQDTVVIAWTQPHLLYHCPVQGGLTRASCL